MPTQITGLRPAPYFPTTIATPTPLGNGSCLLGILYSTVSGSGVNPVGVACVLDTASRLTEIGQSDPTRKDAGITVWRDGTTTLMLISEASQPDGAGNTSTLFLYTFPDTLPPVPPPSPCKDQDARNQAIAATNMAHAAQQTADGAVSSIKGLAAAVGEAVEGYD